jgi:MacB-like periplasmic core domain
MEYRMSTGFSKAAGTSRLTGRSFTWHDHGHAVRVAVVNEEFARRLFGSSLRALGAHFKAWGGTRVEVVGMVENGKYMSLAESPQPAMFFPILQAPSSITDIIDRAVKSRPAGLGAGDQAGSARTRSRAALYGRHLAERAGYGSVSATSGHGGTGSSRSPGRDAGGDGNFRDCGLFRQPTAAGTRNPHRSRGNAEPSALGRAGTDISAPAARLPRGLGARDCRQQTPFLQCVSGDSARSGGAGRLCRHHGFTGFCSSRDSRTTRAQSRCAPSAPGGIVHLQVLRRFIARSCKFALSRRGDQAAQNGDFGTKVPFHPRFKSSTLR